MAEQKPLILITGSSGLIGSAAVKRFTAEGFHVVALDREGPPHPPAGAEVLDLDLASDESVRKAVDQVISRHPEDSICALHLAAYYDFSGEDSPLYEEVTVRGTERLLRELKRGRLEQFVFSSTHLVHASGEPGMPIGEDWPIEPKWPYPKSKVAAEKVVEEQRGTATAVLLRIAGVYTDHCQSIPLANQIQRIYERKLVSHLYPGNPAHGQPFLHLDDLIDAFVLAVERRTQLPQLVPILLAEEETLSYDTLQHMFGRLIHDERWETRTIPKAAAKIGAWAQDVVPGEEPFIKPWMIDLADDHYELDLSRAHQLLGWEPKRNLRDTIPLMVQHLKESPIDFYKMNKLEWSDASRESERDDIAKREKTDGHA
jgi:nucleoside-diphosphate-sugar epimerase